MNREGFDKRKITVYHIKYFQIMEDFYEGFKIPPRPGVKSHAKVTRDILLPANGYQGESWASHLTSIRTLFHTPFLQGIAPAHNATGQIFHPSKSPLHQDSCCQIRAEAYMAIYHGFLVLIEPAEVIPEAI